MRRAILIRSGTTLDTSSQHRCSPGVSRTPFGSVPFWLIFGSAARLRAGRNKGTCRLEGRGRTVLLRRPGLDDGPGDRRDDGTESDWRVLAAVTEFHPRWAGAWGQGRPRHGSSQRSWRLTPPLQKARVFA